MTTTTTTRRTFVTALGGLGLSLGTGLSLTACSSPAKSSTYTGEARTLALAAAVENQLTAVYAKALSTMQAGKLGTVPAAFAEYVRTANAHHAQHADAWNGLLSDARQPTITGTPLSGHESVLDEIGQATTVTELAKLVQNLENRAAQTHLAALGTLTAPADVAIAASIAPVEAMHAAAVGFILGKYPTADGFLSVTGAAHPSDLLA